MNKKRVFSGIQPSGVIHIGNYLGAILQWVEMQKQYDCIFSLVDLHAITVAQDPKKLRENTYKLIAIYLAAGIDPEKSPIFIQSQMSAHTELTWLLNTISYMGELSRMTQYKDKSQKYGSEKAGVGLFDYPVLMAADILLYDIDLVPVGKDQKQHVELCRDLAQRFNQRFGNTFKIPDVAIRKESACIMALDNPDKKMSKSAESIYNYIALEDSPELIRKKISKAVTDSQSNIVSDPNRKGLYNLLLIYQLFSNLTPEKIENKFAGKGYGEFKKSLSDLLIDKLIPMQDKFKKLMSDKAYLDAILESGRKKVAPIAEKTLKKAQEKIGLIIK